jgi:hypothetical protein
MHVTCTRLRLVRRSLLYNEFIVYNTAQVRMRYVIKLGFKFK